MTEQEILLSIPPYKVTSEQITVEEKNFTHYTLHHPGAVVIIPYDNGVFYLLDQYRASIKSTLREFPAGKLEPDEDPLECAKRELAEEAGKTAKKWYNLGSIYPAPGFCNEVQHIFLATELSDDSIAEADEDEVISVVTMNNKSLKEHILNTDTIVDAKTAVSYFKCINFIQSLK